MSSYQLGQSIRVNPCVVSIKKRGKLVQKRIKLAMRFIHLSIYCTLVQAYDRLFPCKHAFNKYNYNRVHSLYKSNAISKYVKRDNYSDSWFNGNFMEVFIIAF